MSGVLGFPITACPGSILTVRFQCLCVVYRRWRRGASRRPDFPEGDLPQVPTTKSPGYGPFLCQSGDDSVYLTSEISMNAAF